MSLPDKKCWHTALRLLTGRDHSCRELSQKLSHRGYTQEQIEPVIQECLRLNYLDDEKFALLLTQQLRRKGYGVLRIAQTLQKKGLVSVHIRTSLDRYCHHDNQLQDCLNMIDKKMARQRVDQDRSDTNVRLYRFLQGRGFSCSIIQEAFRACALDTF